MALTVDRPAIVRLTGHLAGEEARNLGREWMAAIEPLPHPSLGQLVCLFVDLSGVEFIDAAGLAALVQLHRDSRHRSWGIAFINPQPAVRLVFEIAQADRVLDAYPTYEAAMAAWDASRTTVARRSIAPAA